MSSSPTEAALADVAMPQMGVSVAEGTIVEWRKRRGDWVEADEVVAEISTDKIETEIPAPASGRLTEILVEPGATVPVGTVLARIDTAARPGEAHAAEHAAPAGGVDGRHSSVDSRQARVDSRQSTVDRSASAGDGQAPPVSPVVRRIAAEHQLDLSRVEGTGRRGRVTKRDVLAFLEQGATEPPSEPVLHSESPYREEPSPLSPVDCRLSTEPGEPGEPGSPLSPIRRQIADHMVRSLQTAAHCTTVVEADMSQVEAARGRMSYLPFVARATIAALREFPALNATLEGDRLVRHEEVHLGIAVSLGDDGLIVPVVRNAHELSHEGLAARIADLAERARARRLSPDEVRGGTFTITNPGRYGALLATPIINQPQVAILDLEAVVRRPVVVGGDSIAIRPMTYLCMSWDHRALDGALAAQFLSSVRGRLEEWRG